jgi:glycerol-1-phosphate dehydrogenase [NAD(P)+]
MTWHGCKKTLTAVAPKIVVADTEIIKNAPIRLAKSGFGDMVGKYIALTDWKIGNILLNEFYCQKIAGMTMGATKEVMNSIDGIINGKEDAYEKLTYGLLLSGLAMQMIGNSRPASGAEHHISHLIEMKPKGLKVDFDALHGEKVGVGTLIVMKKYQSLMNKTDCNFTDYISPSDEAILKVFEKERFDDIKNENLNDAAQNVTSEVLKAKWQEVFSLLSTLPDAYELKELYVRAGVKSELKDIGVSNDYEEFLLENAPMVRNRLTLLRIEKCF